MDRRLLLLAEPVQLLCTLSKYPSTENITNSSKSLPEDQSTSASCQGYLLNKAAHDLLHLQGVIDHVYEFCNYHGNNCTHTEDSAFTEIRQAVRNVGQEYRGVEAKNGGNIGVSGSEPRQRRSSSRRILLAAVYPCPVPAPVLDDEDDLLPIASAFADVLDSCCMWLGPEDFKAKVLTPTTALIDTQLDRISMMMRRHGDDTSADADGSSLKRPRRNSGGGGDSLEFFSVMSAERAQLLPKVANIGLRPANGDDYHSKDDDILGKPAAVETSATTSEDYINAAAEEVSILLQDALLAESETSTLAPIESITENSSVAAELSLRPALATASGLHKTSTTDVVPTGSRLLLDVLWAASSMPPDEVAVGHAGSPLLLGNRSSMLGSTPTMTLSVPVGDPRALALRKALRTAATIFADSQLTIWPSSTVADEAEIGENEEIELPASTTAKRKCVEWSTWCEVLGARLCSCSFARAVAGSQQPFAMPMSSSQVSTDQRQIPVESGLLWRGPIVPAASTAADTARVSFAAFPAASVSASNVPSDPSIRSQQLQGNNRIPATLGGFAIRARVSVGTSRVLRVDNGGAEHVTESTQEFLARAFELRLARVVSSSAVAGVCHLLADGALAPPLELFVYDPQRFPGSAAFLEDWGRDGRGILLVATAPSSERRATGAEIANGTQGKARGLGEEGLAMICFPRSVQRHGGSNDRSDCDDRAADGTAADREDTTSSVVWSVNLFRRPSQLSEHAVNALIGECCSSNGKTREQETSSMGSAAGLKRTDSAASATAAQQRCYCHHDSAQTGDAEKSYGRQFAELFLSMPRYTMDSLQREAAALARQVDGTDTIPSSPFTRTAVAPPQTEPEPATAGRSSRRTSLRRSQSTVPLSAVGGTKQDTAADDREVDERAPAATRTKQQPASAASGAKRKRKGKGDEHVVGEVSLLNDKERGNAIKGETVCPVAAKIVTVMDARATRLQDAGESTGATFPQDELAVSEASRADSNADDKAFALYGSFGTWGQDGRYGWAEELLLPRSPNVGVNAATGGRRATEASALPRGGVCGAYEEHGKVVEDANGSGLALTLGSVKGKIQKRSLSTAEEALENAGRQQRERVKERRMVAREQRDRMDRPKPRPRDRGNVVGSSRNVTSFNSGSGAVRRATGSGSSISTSTSRGKNVAFRGSGNVSSFSTTTARASLQALPTLGRAGRSASAPKLSRGSRLLGKSVTVEASVVGGDLSQNGAGGEFEGGGMRERVVGEKGESGTDDKRHTKPARTAAGMSNTSIPIRASNGPYNTSLDEKTASDGGMQKSLPLSSATPAGNTAFKRDRVRRAIFQDDDEAPYKTAQQSKPEPSQVPPPGRPDVLPVGHAAGTAGGNAADTAVDSMCIVDRNGEPRSAVEIGAVAETAVSCRDKNVRKSGKVTGVGRWEKREGVLGEERKRLGDSGSRGAISELGQEGSAVGAFSMRQVMERAMLSAIAAQMGLVEDDSRVREVFERESRLMAGGST